MLSPNLVRFLHNLSLDPGLLEAFEADPASTLANADLSADDKRFLNSGDRELWRRDLAADTNGSPLRDPYPWARNG